MTACANIWIQNSVQGDYRIFPLGDSALTVEFGTHISLELNEKALALAAYFEQHPFPGFIEAVPAYSSTTLFFDVGEVRASSPDFPTAFDAVKHLAVNAEKTSKKVLQRSQREVEIPVDFGKASAPDLAIVAEANALSSENVIEIFIAARYRVFMLGFLPGFAYMGEVDDRIATPRRKTPRVTVPKGSVGIAGNQTGIYSLDSPGGWQIIGRTDVPMFISNAANPSLLQPGDTVRFVPVK